MEVISHEIFRAIKYLLIAGVVYIAYKTARENTEDGQQKKVLWKGFLWCAGIALFASLTLGNPICIEQSDPVYGGCEQYADNGYEPTTEQRIADFFYFMILLYIPVVIGALDIRFKK